MLGLEFPSSRTLPHQAPGRPRATGRRWGWRRGVQSCPWVGPLAIGGVHCGRSQLPDWSAGGARSVCLVSSLEGSPHLDPGATWSWHAAGTYAKFTSSGDCELRGTAGGQCSEETAGEVQTLPSPGGPHGLFTPPPAFARLESPPIHPDSCPGSPTLGPSEHSSGYSSPSWALLDPEHLDPPSQLPAEGGSDLRAFQGSRTLDSESLLETRVQVGTWSLPTGQEQEEGVGEECPICTEPYGMGEHRLALLNCRHGLCVGCLHQLLGTSPTTDLGRVRCPLCRQKTPVLEWEICRLQEELLQADGPQCPPPPSPPTPALRGPGPWGFLEHRYQLRFLAGPVGGRGCLPFLPCPPCLSTWLWALRERGPCARRLALLSLLVLELLGLLLIFMPLMLLGLLFMLLDRSGR
ncbi:ring finger protein-like [Marmota flaviventris]|uniref:ring finger protein-like n=1 Tax=Marmota flaviventris TaxID=93162 RepID=UPI003A8846DC